MWGECRAKRNMLLCNVYTCWHARPARGVEVCPSHTAPACRATATDSRLRAVESRSAHPPMHSWLASRLEHRRHPSSPHSFFWRQKWQVMPTAESYTEPRPWDAQRAAWMAANASALGSGGTVIWEAAAR